MKDYSHIFNAHPSFIESMYRKYKEDAHEIDASWRLFFEGFDFGQSSEEALGGGVDLQKVKKEFGVLSIIHGFRDRGHLLTPTNPIQMRKDRRPALDLTDYHLSEADLGEVFQAGAEIGLHGATLKQILDRLHLIYVSDIGFEINHIEDKERRMWLREQIESRNLEVGKGFSNEKKKRILEKLTDASVFEKFLHTKYVGQKRFSLEGGETTIPALDAVIQAGGASGVEEVVIGMAHRGRLNVLANIMGKTYDQIFNEFEGNIVPDLSYGDGDVKYHLGFSSLIATDSGQNVHLKLVPNPSHLEAVNPVVSGFARAKGDLLYNSDFERILPILIHGDAAIAGQGVVYEGAQMSQLKGYFIGGTFHFVINNQVGFTTDFDDARSSTYCTSVAKTIQAPVFHVNGDDPEAVVFACELALAYRQRFSSDVFVDMVCYRRHGHNEGDDPKFTQPKMYDIISKHPNPREIYVKSLSDRGVVDQKLGEEMEQSFWNKLQERLDSVKEKSLPYKYQEPEQAWRSLKKITERGDYFPSPSTGLPMDRLKEILKHLTSIPKGITPLSKVQRLFKGMVKTTKEGNVDWALAELASYASILLEGKDVRMSGQDVKRGTFSHRHAVLRDVNTYQEYNRLDGMAEEQGKFKIYNSLLSEFAVLGFEYGYSMATPDTLVLWEAQFGDFANGATTIFDQFIASSESKWQRMSGLVMLLPHGYSGQGPEHSSARLERYLQQCAEYNLTVANATTPANLFHLMRRQLERPFRKPLVIMSPKNLLRHPKCISKIEDLAEGTRFEEVLDDPLFISQKTAPKVRKLLLCSGQIYYELEEKRESLGIKDIAIVRLEQLYPFPTEQLDLLQKKYNKAEWVWIQEEPLNMGAWQYVVANHGQYNWKVIARKASASPATGYPSLHQQQSEEILAKAFG
jgi:2-oxoglutarate dehydrogenase E1 component